MWVEAFLLVGRSLSPCGQRPFTLWAEAFHLVGRGLSPCGQGPFTLWAEAFHLVGRGLSPCEGPGTLVTDQTGSLGNEAAAQRLRSRATRPHVSGRGASSRESSRTTCPCGRRRGLGKRRDGHRGSRGNRPVRQLLSFGERVPRGRTSLGSDRLAKARSDSQC